MQVDVSAPSRHADWRFLLPKPSSGRTFEHLVLLGASPSMTACVRALGIARRVATGISDDAADAVVVLAGADAPIRDVARAVAAGGVLYWEVDRRAARHLMLTPQRAARRLASAGLTVCDTYWVKPGFPARQMYLPIGSTEALQWYLDTLYRSPSLPRRALKRLLRTVGRSRRGLAACAPCFAMTAVRGAARQSWIVEDASRARSTGSSDAVLLAHGAAEWNRVAVLLFESGGAAPSAVAKLPRRAAFNRKVEWEHACLRDIAAGVPPPLGDSLPASSLFQHGDLSVSVQSCVRGATLSSRSARDASGLLADLRLTADWLARFHRATTKAVVPAGPWLREHLVTGACGRYSETFGLTAGERRLFATLAARVGDVPDLPLPIVWQHTDLGPWNVYRAGSHLSVIDWEVAREGPALTDLLYFVTHWAADTAGRTPPERRVAHFASLHGLDDSSTVPLTEAVQRAISDYMRDLSVSACLRPWILTYMVIEQALDRACRFTTLAPAGPSRREVNRYVDYLGVLAGHESRLFPAEDRHAA